MNLTCYIVDDESAAVDLMREYIEMTPGLTLSGAVQNPLDALEILTSADAPDIAFLDVDMRQMSGLELAAMVNAYTTVVFTTAFPEYALQAFENAAFDYLLKPISYPRFLKCIQRARLRINRNGQVFKDDFFTVKSEIKGRTIKIRFKEVRYIEGAANYVQIYTLEGKYMTYLTMKEFVQHLPATIFVRIHRSFIVNLHFVNIIERAQVKLKSGETLALGDHYKNDFLERMDQKLIRSNRNEG